jgi:uncharacterized protein (UPF0262 family)
VAVATHARPRIAKVVLAEAARIRLSPRLEQERKVALFDLIEDNAFALKNGAPGPYVVHLGIESDRLLFTVCDERDRELARFTLPLVEMRRIVKDYFLICDSYHNAIRTLSPSRIEAIDMGRRGLHDEGAELLREKLAVCIEMDLATARRLFTLICVLHIRP